MSKEGHVPHPSQEAGSRRGSQRHETDLAAPSPVPDALQRLARPGRADPRQVLALQRTLGNQAVQRMLVQRQEPGGGGDGARIANLESRTTALESFKDKTIPWVKKATPKINGNSKWAAENSAQIEATTARVAALESRGSSGAPDSGPGDGHSYEF